MCNNRNEIIAEIRREALNLADNLFGNRNLDEIDLKEFEEITTQIINHVNFRMSREFQNENFGDASENAQEERRIHRDVVNNINNQHMSNNRVVDFDGSSFRYILVNP